MSTKDEEFTNKALFDVQFENKEKAAAEFGKNYADALAKNIKQSEEIESEYKLASTRLHNRTSTFSTLQEMLGDLKKSNPDLTAQAERKLLQLINRNPSDISREKLSKNYGKEKINLDSAPKSLWGKIKSKVNNVLYPGNPQKRLEDAIGAFKKDMDANPETYENLKQLAQMDHPSYDKSGLVSFSEICKSADRMQQFYKDQYVPASIDKERSLHAQEDTLVYSQEREATVQAIHQVRDKAAKEIEQRMEARDNLGLSNMSSGTDKLAEKAEKMKNMSPQERLAYRMAEMRGTKKEEKPKPAKQVTMDTNALLQQKQQGRA